MRTDAPKRVGVVFKAQRAVCVPATNTTNVHDIPPGCERRREAGGRTCVHTACDQNGTLACRFQLAGLLEESGRVKSFSDCVCRRLVELTDIEQRNLDVSQRRHDGLCLCAARERGGGTRRRVVRSGVETSCGMGKKILPEGFAFAVLSGWETRTC